MDYFNIDPNIKKLPPEEIRFISLQAEPFEDRQRIRIRLELTPFQQSPCIELNLSDSEGNFISSVSIIEPPLWKQELIMHVRNSSLVNGELSLIARLFYPERENQDKCTIQFKFPVKSIE